MNFNIYEKEIKESFNILINELKNNQENLLIEKNKSNNEIKELENLFNEINEIKNQNITPILYNSWKNHINYLNSMQEGINSYSILKQFESFNLSVNKMIELHDLELKNLLK